MYKVRAVITDASGRVVTGANQKPVEKLFTITVMDRSQLPDAEAADLAPQPAEAIKEGDAVEIPVTAEKDDTVIVSGLPEGLDYDPETRTIAGRPTAPGDYEVVVLSLIHISEPTRRS